MTAIRVTSAAGALCAAALAVLSISATEARSTQSCESVSPEAAEMLAQQWIAAMRRADTDTLFEMYADDAVIMSPAYLAAKDTPSDVERHLERLAQRFRLVGPVRRTLRTGCNTVVDFGEMKLVARSGGRKLAFDMRYSRVFERRGGYWAITLDHMTRQGLRTPPTVMASRPTVMASRQVPSSQSASDRANLNRLVRSVGTRPEPKVAGMVIRSLPSEQDVIIPPRPRLAIAPGQRPAARRVSVAASLGGPTLKAAQRKRPKRAERKVVASKPSWIASIPGFGGQND